MRHFLLPALLLLGPPGLATLLDRGQVARRELSRTQTHYTQAQLIAATTLTCLVEG
ncbi:hypothetical protein [Roseococcus sp.]|uniref:hypothetical protein n=1 Tax=Roseococcus sp. TaxID=2109646 RepID=UPI003BAC766C